MTLRESLLHLGALYTEAVPGAKLSAISSRVFNDGKTWARLESGGDLTTASFERAVKWFSANWPDGAEWPPGIARPAASTEAA